MANKIPGVIYANLYSTKQHVKKTQLFFEYERTSLKVFPGELISLYIPTTGMAMAEENAMIKPNTFIHMGYL